jgi:NAD(P)-dependent dehydrogenase (short-subunit alcohol dehydrogenase family)
MSKVVIADIRSAEETVETILRLGGEASYVVTDIRNDSRVGQLVEETVTRHGTIDLVCNNAGVELVRLLVNTTEAEWDMTIDTNLKGAYLICKYTFPHMMRNRKGTVVNIASQLGLVGLENFSAYCASKAGLILLTKVMALECAKYGIRVNCICPGAIETPMLEREVNLESSPDQARGRFIAKHPIGRLGRPEEIAQAVLFLASDRSSFITGETLVVDGGYVIQ